MNSGPKRTRVRQLAGSVWPGRAVDGYANLIAARLRKLAAAGSTGMLPVSGPGDGAIFFRHGQVIHAESSRTPGRRTAGLAALGLASTGNGPGEQLGPAGRSLSELAAVLATAEPTIDAATELLCSESRYAKFRPAEGPGVARARPIPLEALLAEVQRRRLVLRQLSAVVTADTVIVRDPRLESPRVQVSAAQWSLLVRVREQATPRSLAMELDRGVFGTTVEVYRLLELGLLAVPGRPAPPPEPAGRGPRAVSFIRAVPGQDGRGE